MQPLIHCLEVSLRNAIDHAIRHNPPPGAVNLWRTDTNWIFDFPRYIGDKMYIRQNKHYKVDRRGNQLFSPSGAPLYHFTAWEEQCIRKVAGRIADAGKTPTAERVISGLDFGFWTNFLSAEYEEARNNTLLWPHLKETVFPGAPKGTACHSIEKKFMRIRELRNRLAHHEAIWKFQETDPATGKPDYSKPIYGLNASLHLLRKAWGDMLEAVYWVSPVRHAAFLTEGHHIRFEALAAPDGLFSFTGRGQITTGVNIRRSPEIGKLLRELKRQKIVRLTQKGQVIAIIGPDFVRL